MCILNSPHISSLRLALFSVLRYVRNSSEEASELAEIGEEWVGWLFHNAQIFICCLIQILSFPSTLESSYYYYYSYFSWEFFQTVFQVGSPHIKPHLINFELLLHHGDSNQTLSCYEILNLSLHSSRVFFANVLSWHGGTVLNRNMSWKK